MSNYVIWTKKIVKGACTLADFTGYAQDWRLLDGQSLKDSFPSSARFDMDPEYPDKLALTDSLYNTDRQIVASPKLRGLLEGLDIPHMEYLPVNVFNHKGRPVEPSYVIAHPIDPIDCIDVAASGADFSLIDTDSIDSVQRLVIDESCIDPARLLFRPKAYYKVILAHRSLADKVDAAGITGVRWIELSDWPG
ncbi:imm11 family protein [Variovorax rhizosphaerae]|uniref:DUF1629 domain-containing protein n=1 Tax=Variovorax rhizosphaerae TaxID=1836200 RepID=A0ABU8WPI1_9BURK